MLHSLCRLKPLTWPAFCCFFIGKQRSCIEKVEIHWTHIIHALTEGVQGTPSNDADGKGVVDQALLELLSLALEYFHYFPVPFVLGSSMQPPVETARDCGSIYQGPLVRTLEILSQCVHSSHCVLSLTKLLSTACRLSKSLRLDLDSFIQLKNAFCFLAASEMTCSSLKHWFVKEGSVALRLAMQMYGRESECIQGRHMSMHDNVHGTVVRKYLLLAFRLWAAEVLLLKEGTLLPRIVMLLIISDIHVMPR